MTQIKGNDLQGDHDKQLMEQQPGLMLYAITGECGNLRES